VMPDTDVQGAIRLADRIRAQIEFSPASWNNAPISLTVSIGVSEILRSDPRSQDSLERADQALYAAKHEGRNRVLAIMR
jgi:diguanylate cyclase (GGDEF)-like protein